MYAHLHVRHSNTPCCSHLLCSAESMRRVFLEAVEMLRGLQETLFNKRL